MPQKFIIADCIIRNAFYNSKNNTWFVTRPNVKEIKDCKLKCILYCKVTKKALYFPDEAKPIVGTILCDAYNNTLEVIQVHEIRRFKKQ